jgi:Rhodococcus equi virulence-associated protein
MNATRDLIREEIIAKDSSLSSENIDAIVESLLPKANRYPAMASAISFIVYLRFQIEITGMRTFRGQGGGLSAPGFGTYWGDVYTDDLSRLYQDTVSFEFQVVAAYISILCFDKNSNYLGSFQGGGAGTIVAAVGGGTGSWS